MKGERENRVLTPWEAVFLASLTAAITAVMVAMPSLLLLLAIPLAIGCGFILFGQFAARLGQRIRAYRQGEGSARLPQLDFTQLRAIPSQLRSIQPTPRAVRGFWIGASVALMSAVVLIALARVPAGPARDARAAAFAAMGLAVLLALLTIGLAAVLATLARDAIRSRGADLTHAPLLANGAYGMIIALGIIAALYPLGVATWIIATLFASLVGMLALAGGISFGFAGRPIAEELLDRWSAPSTGPAPEDFPQPEPAATGTGRPKLIVVSRTAGEQPEPVPVFTEGQRTTPGGETLSQP